MHTGGSYYQNRKRERERIFLNWLFKSVKGNIIHELIIIGLYKVYINKILQSTYLFVFEREQSELRINYTWYLPKNKLNWMWKQSAKTWKSQLYIKHNSSQTNDKYHFDSIV